MKKLISILLFLVFSQASFAYPVELKHPKIKGIIYLDQPEGWEVHQNVMGLPFVLFSPKENGQRTNLSFVPTSASVVMDTKGLQKDMNTYKEGKKKWAEKIGAKINVYEPLKSFQNKHGNKITQIGLQYTFKKKNYIEKSYYIECNGKLVHSKATLISKNSDHSKMIEEMMKGVRCGN